MPANQKKYYFTISDILVASYDIANDTYGVPLSLDAKHNLSVEGVADTDEMPDGGSIARILTVLKGVTFTMSTGGYKMEELLVMQGGSIDSTDPEAIRYRPQVGGKGLPYFGWIGVLAADDDGLLAVGLRAGKLDNMISLTADGTSNSFGVSENAGRGIVSNTTLFEVVDYSTISAWTGSLPADGTEFKAWFSA